MADKSAETYRDIVNILRELGIIKNDYLTEEQLFFLVRKLIEKVNAIADSPQ